VQPGPLIPGDFERIAEHLGEDTETAKQHFVASPGAIVRDMISGKVKRIGTITPKSVKGRCVFLDKDNRCTIHKVAPFGCAYFDAHMSDDVADPRSYYAVKRQSESEYQALRDKLQLSEKYLKQLRERQETT